MEHCVSGLIVLKRKVGQAGRGTHLRCEGSSCNVEAWPPAPCRFWPNGRETLWEEKLGLREKFKGNAATVWGNRRESSALGRYQEITGLSVQSCSFKMLRDDEVHGWLGASPDGLVEAPQAEHGMFSLPTSCALASRRL